MPRRLRCALVIVAACLGTPLLWPSVALSAPPVLTASASALYYESETAAGTLAIDRLSLSVPRTTTQVVTIGNDVTVFGIAVDGPYLFWSFQAGLTGRGAIMRVTLSGQHVQTVVGGLTSPASLIAVRGFVYWSDQRAIGRVALDGSHLRRRFIVLPQETGGGVADGLASDGAHLYFSRCLDHTIGRADLDGGRLDPRFLSLGNSSCPQGIATADRHLYWTQLGTGTIGRASVDGHGANGRWLGIRTGQGPFQVVADRAHVYWSWGGVDGTPSWTGRANADGSHLDRRFLADSLYPLALTGEGDR